MEKETEREKRYGNTKRWDKYVKKHELVEH